MLENKELKNKEWDRITDEQKWSSKIIYKSVDKNSPINSVIIKCDKDYNGVLKIDEILLNGPKVKQIWKELLKIESLNKFTNKIPPKIKYEELLPNSDLEIRVSFIVKKIGTDEFFKLLNIICNEVQKSTPSFSSVIPEIIVELKKILPSEKIIENKR